MTENISNITTDEKTLNGEETGDSENVTNEEEETVINSCYYDKTKSFFDNLSSENTRYMHILTFCRLCNFFIFLVSKVISK